jgi:hypothetical protein
VSTRYPGGVITKTPIVPSGPYESGTASGVWTLEQQLQAQEAGIWPTAGLQPDYIEDVFATFLYTGNGSTRTINNGVDLAGEGGLVWLKKRGVGTGDHHLYDTVRGATNMISSNTTGGTIVRANGLTAFNSNGFSIGAYSEINGNGDSQASWTFRKQPKFFDVVTYTGNGSTQNIPHNLGSTPGCIIVKNITTDANWTVYHQSLGADYQLRLNLTGASNFSAAAVWGNNTTSVTPTSTQFTVGSNFTVNQSGATHVAYLFAHDAGGFGLTGTDNVISCGSYTGTGAAGNTITLGYEPQWLIIKRATGTGDWHMFDTMRMMTADGNNLSLYANLASGEPVFSGSGVSPLATGFKLNSGGGAYNNSGDTYIYIAIRRGPMKVPTVGTSVFEANAGLSSVGIGANTGITDLIALFVDRTSPTTPAWLWADRLRGYNSSGIPLLNSASAGTEDPRTSDPYMRTEILSFAPSIVLKNSPAANSVWYRFRRAPGFFDEVCYTGTNYVSPTKNHNLSAIPELLIHKQRNSSQSWWVFPRNLGVGYFASLNSSDAAQNFGTDVLQATSSTFYASPSLGMDASGGTYVAYLFASCPGVSKVGSYTGTGTTLQINCGFTSGARFVLIKRTDATGDWYVWDSARGIVAGNDPYLLLNSDAAQNTSTDYIDTFASGFEISSTAPAAINASGGTFIFLAIA